MRLVSFNVALVHMMRHRRYRIRASRQSKATSYFDQLRMNPGWHVIDGVPTRARPRPKTRSAAFKCGASSILPSSEATPSPPAKAAPTARAWTRSASLGVESGVDHRDLVGVDREAAGEALAGGAFSVGSEALQLAKSAWRASMGSTFAPRAARSAWTRTA